MPPLPQPPHQLHLRQPAPLYGLPTTDRVALGVVGVVDVACPAVGVVGAVGAAWAETVGRRCLQLSLC